MRRSFRISHITSPSVLNYSEEEHTDDNKVVKLVLNRVQNGGVGKNKNKNKTKIRIKILIRIRLRIRSL